MTRIYPRTQTSTVALHTNARFAGPPLNGILGDTVIYTENLLRSIDSVTERINNLGGRRSRGEILGQMKTLQTRTKAMKAEVADLRMSNFPGLQRIIRQPQCIILEQLARIIPQIRLNAYKLCTILYDNLRDSDASNKWETFQGAANGLSQRVSSVLSSWRSIGDQRSSWTPLCGSALRLIDNKIAGIVTPAVRDSLLRWEKDHVKQMGGLFQHWKCVQCQKDVTFYTKRANNPIELAKTFIKHDKDNVSYRSVMCAKSHLKHRSVAKYACLICLGLGRNLALGESAFDTEKSLARHVSSSHTSSSLPRVFMQLLHFTKKSDFSVLRSDLQFLDE